MGATRNIWEDLLEDTSFGLFAIHSHLEDHTLAYALNQACAIRLSRTADDLRLGKDAAFPIFQWKDEAGFQDWTLVRNTGAVSGSGRRDGLFPDEPMQVRQYLIPEKKEVDYFLKLEGEDRDQRVLTQLLAIPKVITAYSLEPAQLKSKQNLIF